MKVLWKVLSVGVMAASLIAAYAVKAEKNSASSVLDSCDQTVSTNTQELVADGLPRDDAAIYGQGGPLKPGWLEWAEGRD